MNIEPNDSIALEGDAELLAKYIECNDRVAIESLIVRYSPMVASVCRVTTRHRCDAEDAFQATFQVLLESARKVRKRQSIAAWLHGVAFRIASRVRAKQQRYSQDISSNQASTREIDEPTDQYDPVVLVTRKIELEKLVIEVQRLPEKIRSAVVEHYLLGLTADEIALRMDTTLSTIEGRLRRGRQVLRARLVKQGISLSIALAAVAVLEQHLNASESGVWCTHFLNHELNDYLLGSGCQSTSRVESLVRGELQMSTNLFVVKSSLSLAALGAFSSVAAMAYFADEGAGNRALDNHGVATLMFEHRETQGKNGIAHVQPAPMILSQSPVQSPQPKDTLSARPTNPAVGGPAATVTNAVAEPHNAVASIGTAPGPAVPEKMEPEKIVPWKSPMTPKPAWLEGSTAEDEIEMSIEKNRQILLSRLKEGVNWPAVPLSRVLEQLKDEAGCNFWINRTDLETEGIDPDSPITLEFPPCSLRETLAMILRPYGLTYRVREAGIEITTESAVSDGPGTLRCYDLSHIFPSSEHANSLVQTIEVSIEPDSWLDSGGTHTISMVGSVMVVSCSENAHSSIETLLRSIAKMDPGNSKPPVVSPPRPFQGQGGMGGGFF